MRKLTKPQWDLKMARINHMLDMLIIKNLYYTYKQGK